MNIFSPRRFWAMVVKEFVQMRRDRVTFAMMIGIPLMQLILFGFAINSNPQNLPLAVLSNDDSEFSRTLVTAMQNSLYYRVTNVISQESEARKLLDRGEVLFVLTIPQDFGRLLARGDRPTVLVEADASDPTATGFALGSLDTLFSQSLTRDLLGPLLPLRAQPGPVDLRIHRLYNPEIQTKYNIVPGLMGVVLTMTMVIITALAITRERERGTMENLLCTPVRPFEVMIGKIVPYIVVGYIQMLLIIVAPRSFSRCPSWGACRSCWRCRFSLSRPIWPWASPSPLWPRTSFRPCRWRSFSFCRRFCCPDSCFRSRACPCGRSGWGPCCP